MPSAIASTTRTVRVRSCQKSRSDLSPRRGHRAPHGAAGSAGRRTTGRPRARPSGRRPRDVALVRGDDDRRSALASSRKRSSTVAARSPSRGCRSARRRGRPADRWRARARSRRAAAGRRRARPAACPPGRRRRRASSSSRARPRRSRAGNVRQKSIGSITFSAAGQRRQQLEELEDEADVAAAPGARARSRPRARPMSLPPTTTAPDEGAVDAADRFSSVDLPLPDLPDDRDELARADLEVDVAERREARRPASRSVFGERIAIAGLRIMHRAPPRDSEAAPERRSERVRSAAVQPDSAALQDNGARSTARRSTLRVLVVEDEPRLSRAARRRALATPATPSTAPPTGERADFLGQTESYDAVVLDLGLPKIDGLTVLRRWREAGIAVPGARADRARQLAREGPGNRRRRRRLRRRSRSGWRRSSRGCAL